MGGHMSGAARSDRRLRLKGRVWFRVSGVWAGAGRQWVSMAYGGEVMRAGKRAYASVDGPESLDTV